MLTITAWEVVLALVLAIALGAAIWDVFWTAVISDATAAAHFVKAGWLRRVMWIVGMGFAIAVLYGLYVR